MAESFLVEEVDMTEKYGTPKNFHVLGHDVRVFAITDHHVN